MCSNEPKGIKYFYENVLTLTESLKLSPFIFKNKSCSLFFRILSEVKIDFKIAVSVSLTGLLQEMRK